jgi:K+-transporting ATPase KdpF subunit
MGLNLGNGGMNMFDYILSGGVAFGLTVYMIYALLRPERF